MSSPPLFHEVVDAADALSEEEQEALIELLRRRLAERGRQRIIDDVRQGQEDFKAGKCRSMTVEEFMKEIES